MFCNLIPALADCLFAQEGSAPAALQLVVVTDIVWPPGVTMRRKVTLLRLNAGRRRWRDPGPARNLAGLLRRGVAIQIVGLRRGN
jgi:hypothetical protein